MDGFFRSHAWTAQMESQEPESPTPAPSKAVGNARATDHSIYLLFPFSPAEPTPRPRRMGRRRRGERDAPRDRPEGQPSTSLAELTVAAWQPTISGDLKKKAEDAKRTFDANLPEDSQHAESAPDAIEADSPRATESIWSLADWSVAPDMDPHVAQLLSQVALADGGSEEGANANQVTVWALKLNDNNIRNALRGRAGLARFIAPQLAIKFSQAAVKRMEAHQRAEAPKNVAIEISAVRALAFRTGQGLLVAELNVRPDGRAGSVPMPVLVESLVALCSDRHLTWLARDGEELELRSDPTPLRLRDMLTTLLGDFTARPITGARVFSYTYAKLDHVLPSADRHRLMIQLACKYTDDYRIALSSFSERIYQPFESISHLAALEGAVTMVEDAPFEDRPRASFLADYGASSIDRRYLPVVVLAYHGFQALLDLTQDSRTWIDLRAPSRRDADRLRRLHDDILAFRLFHRLSYVSLLTMPNELHRRLSEAFGLERMLTTADRDVTEIGAYLDGRLKQADAHRSAWFRRLTAASLAVISGATLGRILVETLPHVPVEGIRAHAAWAAGALDWIHDIGPATGVGHVIELGVAVVFGMLGWWWSEGEHVDPHMRDELIVHMRREMDE
jgi:hypothetical protein